MNVAAVLVLLAAIVLHEAAHLAAFRLLGVRARLSLRPLAIDAGTLRDHLALRPGGNIMVVGAGVVAGTLPFLLAWSELGALIYAGLCLSDLGALCLLVQVPKEYREVPLRNYLEAISASRQGAE